MMNLKHNINNILNYMDLNYQYCDYNKLKIIFNKIKNYQKFLLKMNMLD